MPARIEAVSTLTDRYQTTVPSTVRRALDLKKHDRLRYTLQPGGGVLLERVEDDGADPALSAFLDLLARDIAERPDRLRSFDAGLRDRLRPLVAGVEPDLDAPLSPDDE